MPDYNPQDFSPSYGGQIDSNGNVKNLADAIKGTGANTKLAVDIGGNIELKEVDIQIGAVELKDAVDGHRAKIFSDGSIAMRVVGSIDGGVWS